MMSQCNFISDAIWVREVENGVRHITLRRNFTEETRINESSEDKQFIFEETDVYIPDRDNIEKFINENFDNLFSLGLHQSEEIKSEEEKKTKTKQIFETGQLIDELQMLGQQITNIMLEV